MEMRPLKFEERKYTYAQSQQIRGQTGSIGRLRGDFDSGGHGFFTTWEDHNKNLNTPDFKSELDNVINSLRSEECGLLKDRVSMSRFAREYPESTMKGSYTAEYGFRVNSDTYSYLIRCNPTKGDYNFYCFCYRREDLDKHISEARQDIRFIDSHYHDLFKIPDGASIRITEPTGNHRDYTCRYIDEAHVEVGNNLFHICEFAERMEHAGNSYKPKEEPLPPYCFSTLPSTGEIIKIKRYEKGYIPMHNQPVGDAKKLGANPLNEAIGVTRAQAAAMTAGSMFGWDCPASKPKNYDENGKAVRPKEQER